MMRAVEGIESFTGDNRFLSNFYYHPITYEGIRYPSNEHAFVAAKSEDSEARHHVAALPSPGKAKRFGRTLRLRPGWDGLRVGVMRDLVALKFEFGSGLSWQLALTDSLRLVEGNNWHDQFWGDCRCGRPACSDPGLNVLGGLLMGRRGLVQRAGW